jgi:aminocarboxymuconate-semialdehyde decarboxylase
VSFKIDIHTHIIPEHLPRWSEKFGYGGFINLEHHKPCCARMMKDDEFFREIQSNCWDPVVRMDDCDHHHIDVQVLSTIPVLFSYWARPQDGLDVSRFLNDHIASVVERYPQRFAGLGTIPMQAPDLAIGEIERCKKLGLRGIEIGSNINDINLNERQFFPIYEAAEQLGMALFVHPWNMMGTKQMDKYWLPWLVGMPAETSRAICSMIFGGVFDRYKNLKVAFAHGGGSFASTIGRIEQGFKVRPDLTALDNDVNPRDYLGKFYVDSLIHDPNFLQFVIDLIGEDRVMIGSDYPFPLGEDVPGEIITALHVSKATKDKLNYKNALEWLGIKEPSNLADFLG